MIERAPALPQQTPAIILLAPMSRKFPVHRRQIAEHKPTTIDIGRPSGRDGIIPIEKKGFPSGVTSHHLPSRRSVRKNPVARKARLPSSPPKRSRFGVSARHCASCLASSSPRLRSISTELTFSGQEPGRYWPKPSTIPSYAVLSASLGGSTRNGPTVKGRGTAGCHIPRRTEVRCEASIEPPFAVTGNVFGSRPAAFSEGPPIMPIERGKGAPSQIVRSPALRGAIVTLPRKDWPGALSICSINATGSSLGFSTGMKSLLVADQFQTP